MRRSAVGRGEAPLEIDTARRIAGDRVIAWIGAGDEESREEMVTFGYDFGDLASRLAALDAGIGPTVMAAPP